MLWIESFHIIFVIAWFCGIFYLPRLYVYHAMSSDDISIVRFKIMERRLYFGIIWPSAILATFFGAWLLTFNWEYYSHQNWMHAKLILVLLLWLYQFYLGHLRKAFLENRNMHSHKFYRWLNEFPTLLLIGIVILAIVKPMFNL